MSTTGGFSGSGLLKEEQLLILDSLDVKCALEIGEIAKSFGVTPDEFYLKLAPYLRARLAG